jgi:hypothetical protein
MLAGLDMLMVGQLMMVTHCMVLKTCRSDIMRERVSLVYYRVGHMVSLKTRTAITGWKSLRAPLVYTRSSKQNELLNICCLYCKHQSTSLVVNAGGSQRGAQSLLAVLLPLGAADAMRESLLIVCLSSWQLLAFQIYSSLLCTAPLSPRLQPVPLCVRYR